MKKVIEKAQGMSRGEAVTIASALKGLKVRIDELDAQKKEYQTKLIEFAEANPDEFKGKTLDLGDAKVKLMTSTKFEKSKAFDEKAFIERYPEVCELGISNSKVKGLIVLEETRKEMEELGLKQVVEDSYAVEITKG